MNTELLAARLKVKEGFRAESYEDNGGWSWGYGHWSKEKPEGTISEDMAGAQLMTDIYMIVARLSVIEWWKEETQLAELSAFNDVRQRVFVELAYNVGVDGALKFVNTIEAIKSGDFKLAADELLDSLAACQNPQRYQEMALMMKTGVDNPW